MPIGWNEPGAGDGVGLTDTELRASPVPVSGPVTDAQLRATAVPTSLATLPALAAGEAHAGEVGGKTVIVSTEMTRPENTDAYIAGDVWSNSTVTTVPITMANVARVNGGSGYITGCRTATDKKSITPRLRVHMFNANNPTVSADNAPYQEKYADTSKRVGYFDLPAMTTAIDTTNSDMSRSFDFTLRLPFACAAADRNLYLVLESLDGWTPANAQKITVILYAELN